MFSISHGVHTSAAQQEAFDHTSGDQPLCHAAAPSVQQWDRWSKPAEKEQQHGMYVTGSARRYDLDSTVRVFRSLQAASALPLPAELRDAATTDPELLATSEAPANVLKLLAEPLHVTSGDGSAEEAEQGLHSLGLAHAAKLSVDPELPEAVGTPEVPAVGQQLQPSASLPAESRRDEAAARASPAAAAGHDQIYSYKDPAGVMQVRSL